MGKDHKVLIIFSLKGLISLGTWVKDHKSQFTERKTAVQHTPVCWTSLMTREMHRKRATKFPFSGMKLARIKRFNHTLLARESRKAYNVNGSVNLYNVYGGQFNHTYQRNEDTCSWTRKFLYIKQHSCKFKGSHCSIVNNIKRSETTPSPSSRNGIIKYNHKLEWKGMKA